MKRKKYFFCLYFGILFTLLIFTQGCKKNNGYQPIEGTITESVYASGIVKAELQYKVFSSVPGILIKTHVTTGDTVKRGDPIFTIQNQTAAYNIDNSRLALRKTQEGLKKINEKSRQLVLEKEKYIQDSIMLARQKRLWDQGVSTKVQLENADMAMKVSKTQYLNAITELDQTKSILKADYEAAKNNMMISKETAAGYIIKSETGGKVYIIYPEVGEGITSQTVLAVIGKPDKFEIQIQVDENDIAKIHTGQDIFVTMDSYKDSVFKAKVTKVYPIMNESTGTFTVEGIFTKAPSILYPHLNLEANILIGSKNNAMMIPREYLIEDNFVQLEDGQKTKVKVGLRNYEYVEITSGLKKGQMIFKP